MVVAPGLPTSEVTIREPRMPVVKWPHPGDTLPITVDVDDMRRVRINWDEANPRERGEDPPPPITTDFPDGPGYADTTAEDYDDDLLGDLQPPPWTARGQQSPDEPPWTGRDQHWQPSSDEPPPPPPAGASYDEYPVVVRDTPAGPVVEGEFVDHNDPPPLPRRAAAAAAARAAGAAGPAFAEPGYAEPAGPEHAQPSGPGFTDAAGGSARAGAAEPAGAASHRRARGCRTRRSWVYRIRRSWNCQHRRRWVWQNRRGWICRIHRVRICRAAGAGAGGRRDAAQRQCRLWRAPAEPAPPRRWRSHRDRREPTTYASATTMAPEAEDEPATAAPPPTQREPHPDDALPVDVPLDEPTPEAPQQFRRPEPTATSTPATPSPMSAPPTAPPPMTAPPTAPEPSILRPRTPRQASDDEIDLPLDGRPRRGPRNHTRGGRSGGGRPGSAARHRGGAAQLDPVRVERGP